MRKGFFYLSFFLALLLFNLNVFGEGFTFYAKLKRGGALINATKHVRCRIYDSSSGGTLLSTVEGDITIRNGHFSVELPDVDRAAAWVEVTVDGDTFSRVKCILPINKSKTNWIDTGMIKDGAIINADLSSGSFSNITGVGTLGSLSVSGSTGIGTTSPDRKLDILDSSDPQFRLTYTDGSVYTDLQTNSSGYLYLNPSGDRVGIETSSPSYTLDVKGTMRTGIDGTDGQLKIYSEQGTTDYTVTLNPNSAMTQDTTYTLPADDGTSGYYLTTDGSGGLSWGTPAGTGANTALSNLASVAINTSLISDTNNTDDLGSSAIKWKDLYLAGNLSDGTNTAAIADIVTKTGTQTLTNKTLTSPAIGTSPTAAGAMWTDLGSVTTVDINGGSIDGTTIGASSAAAATVSSLTATTVDINGGAIDATTIGGASTAPGSFTTVSTTGNVSIDNQSDLLLYEGDAGGSNYMGFQAPATLGADFLYTLPNAYGTNGQYLQTDGSGTLSWATVSSGISQVGSMTTSPAFGDNTCDDDWLGLGASEGRIEFDNQTIDEVSILNASVGIGSPSPSSHLDLEKGGTAKSNLDIIELTNSGNASDMDGTETSILFNQYYYDASTPAVADAGRISVGTETDWTSTAISQDGYMAFGTVADGTVSEWMRINSKGCVGIGSNVPSISNNRRLHVEGQGADDYAIWAEGGSTGCIIANATGGYSGYFIITGDKTSAPYACYLTNTSTNTATDGINKYGLYITSPGAFTGGAGAACNNYGLYINTPTGGDNNYSIYLAGNTQNRIINSESGGYLSNAGIWTDGSSREYKQQIAPLRKQDYEETLEILDKIDVVYFKYNAEVKNERDSAKKHIGIIAEDAPDIITDNEKKGLPASDAVGFLLAVAKAQQKQINLLSGKEIEKELKETEITKEGDLVLRNDSENRDLLFEINQDGTTTEAMQIDGSTGNVGIGLVSPKTKLEVNGTIKSSGSDIAWTTDNFGVGLELTQGNSLMWDEEGGTISRGIVVEDDKLYFLRSDDATGSSEAVYDMVIDENGNVGIGTTETEDYKLSVAGDTYIDGTISATKGVSGYVISKCINGAGAAVTRGDLVKVKSTGISQFTGRDNLIPVPEVTLTEADDEYGVMGIVLGASNTDLDSAQNGEYVDVVTHGTFAVCKVTGNVYCGSWLVSSAGGYAKEAGAGDLNPVAMALEGYIAGESPSEYIAVLIK